ncbi:hypothetical protein [Mycolicibacterium thermoresistibile]
MDRKRRQRDWPGAPHGAWAEAHRGLGVPPLPRPQLPDWRDAEVFADRVRLRPTTPSPLGTVGVGGFLVLLAVLAGWQDRSAVLVWGLGSAAAVCLTAGVFWMWWLPARHQHRVRRMHARALVHGVGGHAYRTGLSWHDGEGSPTPIFLLLDERLSDDAAARMQHAFRIWLRRILADRASLSAARQMFTHRWAVPVTEIFGPEATGAWLVLDQGADDSPWRLLIDRPTGAEAYHHDEIMIIDGPSHRLSLELG